MSEKQQVITTSPLKLIYKCVNDVITVYLKDHTILKGLLLMADNNMNLIMDDAEEINDNGETKIKYGKILVRGNNILYIIVSPTITIS
ncbi:MAG: LSM domain-containing protein [Thermoproteota archaeon]|jgi:Small nuclear ribonucleoprotein (snRNP) homolog